MLIARCEMKHRTADHNVGGSVRERHPLDRFHAEVAAGESRSEGSSQTPDRPDRAHVRIGAENFILLFKRVAQKVDEIAARTAARVEDTHSRAEAAAQELVEKVDVDRTELFGEA